VKTHQQYFWHHCLECHEASKHHLLKFGSFSYWFDKPFSQLREDLLLCSSYLLLGFPTGWSSTSTPHHQQVFWRRCRGGRRLLQGESLTHNLLLCFCFTLFYFCMHLFIKNIKKLVPLIVCIPLLLPLVHYVVPEVYFGGPYNR
jgi:hypothetical protein